MIARNFKFGDITLPDPDPDMHADDVRKLYASSYPALTNAVITYPEGQEAGTYEFQEKGGKSTGAAAKSQTVEFKPSVGRKG